MGNTRTQNPSGTSIAQNSSSRHAQPVNGALAIARAGAAGEPPARPGAPGPRPAGWSAAAGFTGPVAAMAQLSALGRPAGDPRISG